MQWNISRRSLSSACRWPLYGACCLLILSAAAACAQDPFGEPSQTPPSTAPVPQDARYAALTEQLNRVRFRGHFTIVRDGKTQSQQEEEYVIQSAKKLPQGDKWQLNATIRYGKVNATVPLVLDIKWADQTPVITLDKLTIPGLGTFSARVLIHENRYAGTWQHDQVGGHLYGTIEKLPPADDDKQ